MKPTIASLKRHEQFRAEVRRMLSLAGATVKEDDHYTLKLVLPNKRVCDVEFTMFKSDGEQGKRPSEEYYCLFCRLAIGAPDFAKHVATVNAGYWNEMSPSGKWNILFGDPKDIYNELEKRLKWLMQ